MSESEEGRLYPVNRPLLVGAGVHVFVMFVMRARHCSSAIATVATVAAISSVSTITAVATIAAISSVSTICIVAANASHAATHAVAGGTVTAIPPVQTARSWDAVFTVLTVRGVALPVLTVLAFAGGELNGDRGSGLTGLRYGKENTGRKGDKK